MRRLQKLQRSDRDDPRRIDIVVRVIVVTLDVIEIDGLRDSGNLIEIAQVSVEIRIIDDSPKIALEMPVINRIESNQRYE